MSSNRLSRYFLFGMSTLFLLVLGYAWMVRGGSVANWEMLLYYGGPVLLSCMALACAFLPASARAVVSVGLLSLGAGIGAAEVFFGLTAKSEREARHRAYLEIWAEHRIAHDPRRLLEVVKDFRESGVNAYPKLNPGTVIKLVRPGLAKSLLRADGTELSPLGTISKTTSVYCNESGDFLVYDSDEHGFHNPRNIWTSERIQIAGVGDSYTEGACVPSSQNLGSLIRQHYPLTLNLGMGGNGPLMELAGLTEYLTHKRPEIVLWFFTGGNDITDLELESDSPLLMRYLDDGFTQNLIGRQPSVDRAIRTYMDRNIERADGPKDTRKSNFVDFLLLRNLRGKLTRAFRGNDGAIAHPERSLNLFRHVLATAKSRTEQWGGALIFVYVPSRRTIAAELEPSMSTGRKGQVLAVARELGIRVVDPTPELAAPPGLDSRYVFPNLGHLNESGYRVVATKVLQTVDEVLGFGSRPSHGLRSSWGRAESRLASD